MFGLIRDFQSMNEAVRCSMLLSSPEAIYTHFNISNG